MHARGSHGNGEVGGPSRDFASHQAPWAGVVAERNGSGARTPEELETLLEDALVLRDSIALAALFEPGAVLAANDEPPARGAAIARLALALWGADDTYVADPKRVVLARDVALIVAERGVNVMRRGGDGAWRYAIVCQTIADGTDGTEGKETAPWS